MVATTCCFTGHRKLPAKNMEHIVVCLNDEIDRLISLGVTNFISGGALGFDQIAASMIVAKKEMGADIRLIFALPCRNQDEQWTEEQTRLYRGLVGEADDIRYVSEEYSSSCMKERNCYMVDSSDYCLCALLREKSGTAQTVRYARRKGLRIINIAK